MTSTEIALLLQNDTEKIRRIGEIIGKKITVKDNFSTLNAKEKTFIYLDILEHHVTQGGFIQFFFNSSGQFAHEILQAYQDINATHTVVLLKEAIELFPVIPIPKNIRIRQEALMQDQKNLDLWDHLDTIFDNYEDDIVALTLDYVRTNISYFD